MAPLQVSPENNRTEKSEEVDKKNDGASEEDAKRQRTHPFREALPQVLATGAKNILLLGYGLTLGFPTIVIPSLMVSSDVTSDNVTDFERNVSNAAPEYVDPYQLHLTREEISWFSSINMICVPIGCMLSGILTQPFGRKPSMIAINIPIAVAWLIYHYSSTYWMLYLAVALTGLSGGLLEAPVLTYVAEITTPQLRGMLSATASTFTILGIFVSFLLGSFMYWRTAALFNVTFPVIAIIALCGVPESPHWLIGKGRIEEAEKSLQWLRGWVEPSRVQAELSHLVKAIQTNNNQDDKKNTSWEPFTRPTFVRPYIIISTAFLVGHFCGMTTLQTFAVNIFADLGTPIDKYIATLILGLGQVIGALVCVASVHYTGKRLLGIVSLVGCGVCFAVVAVYAIMHKAQGDEIQEQTWTPIVFLVLSAFMTHIGIRLLPWILTGEMYPQNIRATASGASASISYVFGFIANKSFFMIVDMVQLSGTFCLNAIVSFVGALYIYYQLPETEGRTLMEIEEHFAGVKRIDSKRVKSRENWARDNPALEHTESHI